MAARRRPTVGWTGRGSTALGPGSPRSRDLRRARLQLGDDRHSSPKSAYLNKGLWIRLVDERVNREKNFLFQGGVTSFVRHLNRHREALHQQPIYVERVVEGTSVEVALQYNDGFAETVLPFANNIHTVDGGTHVTGFRAALTSSLNDWARKASVLSEKDTNLSGDDVREGLTAVISVKLTDPQFEGQTKAKLGNADIKGIVQTVVSDGIVQHLEEKTRRMGDGSSRSA